MNSQYVKTNGHAIAVNQADGLEVAKTDLFDELERRLLQGNFYGTVSLQINFRSGKYNWHRITSEYTRGAGNTK